MDKVHGQHGRGSDRRARAGRALDDRAGRASSAPSRGAVMVGTTGAGPGGSGIGRQPGWGGRTGWAGLGPHRSQIGRPSPSRWSERRATGTNACRPSRRDSSGVAGGAGDLAPADQRPRVVAHGDHGPIGTGAAERGSRPDRAAVGRCGERGRPVLAAPVRHGRPGHDRRDGRRPAGHRRARTTSHRRASPPSPDSRPPTSTARSPPGRPAGRSPPVTDSGHRSAGPQGHPARPGRTPPAQGQAESGEERGRRRYRAAAGRARPPYRRSRDSTPRPEVYGRLWRNRAVLAEWRVSGCLADPCEVTPGYQPMEAYCFTVIMGLQPDEVILRLGGDPGARARPSRSASGPWTRRSGPRSGRSVTGCWWPSTTAGGARRPRPTSPVGPGRPASAGTSRRRCGSPTRSTGGARGVRSAAGPLGRRGHRPGLARPLADRPALRAGRRRTLGPGPHGAADRGAGERRLAATVHSGRSSPRPHAGRIARPRHRPRGPPGSPRAQVAA